MIVMTVAPTLVDCNITQDLLWCLLLESIVADPASDPQRPELQSAVVVHIAQFPDIKTGFGFIPLAD
jgi:hypothetical protein